jgi:Ca2+/Na+ antiporter
MKNSVLDVIFGLISLAVTCVMSFMIINKQISTWFLVPVVFFMWFAWKTFKDVTD